MPGGWVMPMQTVSVGVFRWRYSSPTIGVYSTCTETCQRYVKIASPRSKATLLILSAGPVEDRIFLLIVGCRAKAGPRLVEKWHLRHSAFALQEASGNSPSRR